MAKSSLAGAVEKFSAVTHSFTDQDLEKEWAWGDYNEGVRFAFFRVYEDLRELAARVAAQRSVEGPAMTTAQFVLVQYHAAYRDLQAVLIGLSDEQAVQEPSDEQWPVVQVLLHIVQAESAFYAVNHYAIKRLRTKEQVPLEMSDEIWLAYQDADNFEALKENQSLSGIMNYYEELALACNLRIRGHPGDRDRGTRGVLGERTHAGRVPSAPLRFAPAAAYRTGGENVGAAGVGSQ